MGALIGVTMGYALGQLIGIGIAVGVRPRSFSHQPADRLDHL
jgi:hypothetical protein